MKLFLFTSCLFTLVDALLYLANRKTFNGNKLLIFLLLGSLVFTLLGINFSAYLMRYFGWHSAFFSKIFTTIILIYGVKITYTGVSLLRIGVGYLLPLKQSVTPTFNRAGHLLAIGSLCFLLYAILEGRTHYVKKEIHLSFPNLPPAFEGFSLTHVSDFHIGSYHNNRQEVQKIVNQANSLNSDAIVFTGDLVNFYATEIKEFEHQLRELRAPYGVYSVLGNHDYGYYFPWESDSLEKQDMLRNIALQRRLGFVVLKDSVLHLYKGQDSLEILGSEHWDKKPKRQYAQAERLFAQSDSSMFRILLTHNPLFWDEKVRNLHNVELSLAGHTHGGQLVLDLGFYKLAPATYKFNQSLGLYQNGRQYLYVNPGVGSNGLLGRFGAFPEFTKIILHRGG